MIHIVLTLLIFSLASPAFAETFRWVDESGGVHFSDDFTKIPYRYQPSSVRIEGEPDSNRPTDETRAKGAGAEPKDRLGKGEAYWKERVAETKNRIKSLQDRSESLRLRYNELTTRFNASRSSDEKASIRDERDGIRRDMEKNKAEIAEAKDMLEKKIPEEAELYKANPEWIK